MLVVDEPILSAHPVEFIGPPPHPDGNTLQFFVFGGSMSARDAAAKVLKDTYVGRGQGDTYIPLSGADGGGVFTMMLTEGEADRLHGDVYWVGDTLVCCIKVNPAIIYDYCIPSVFPTVRALHC